MTMKEFKKITKLLKSNGYRNIGRDGVNKETYTNEDQTIFITIEYCDDEMTAEDEELVKQRLIELGYLMVFI